MPALANAMTGLKRTFHEAVSMGEVPENQVPAM